MPSLIKPVSVVTKDGECEIRITLEINLNLNTGDLSLTSVKASEAEGEPEMMVPEFGSEKVKFGKGVEEKGG